MHAFQNIQQNSTVYIFRCSVSVASPPKKVLPKNKKLDFQSSHLILQRNKINKLCWYRKINRCIKVKKKNK